MKNCVFNHNIITLTLPCSLLFLWRFYYPVLAVNYYHLRVFVKEAVLLISTHIFWKHLGAWGLIFLFFQNNAASSSWEEDPAPPQGKGAADGIVSPSTVFSKYSLPANFWGHFNLKVSVLPASCLFVSPTKERQSKRSPDKYLMSAASSHAAGRGAAPAAGGGAPGMLQSRTVPATLSAGAAAALGGQGLCCDAFARWRTPARWCPTCPASASQCKQMCWAWSLQSSLLITACQHPAPPQKSCNCVPPGVCLSDASLLLLLGVP